MSWIILNAHALHIPLRDESVQCVVTSPPYWGLRDYGLKPTIWGGNPDCEHEWVSERIYREMRRGVNLALSAKSNRGGAKNVATVPKQAFTHSFCLHCDAWEGCLGLEPSPELFVEHIVQIFREVWRVLRKDGTIWVNMGDSYTDSGRGADTGSTLEGTRRNQEESRKTKVRESAITGLKPKNLVGMPWRVAFALQADGWTLRRDIIWEKKNPMPESATDRPTTSHEYIFLLSKSRHYFYDGQAIAEPASEDTHARYARGRSDNHKYADGWPGNQTIAKTFQHMIGTGVGWGRQSELDPRDNRVGRGRIKREGPNSQMHVPRDPAHVNRPKADATPDRYRSSASPRFGHVAGWRAGVNPKAAPADSGIRANESFSAVVKDVVETRNSRSVWSMANQPYSGAHFATFPEELATRCIKAGTSEKGCCVECGKPWRRIIQKSGGTLGKSWHDHTADDTEGQTIDDQDKSHGRNGEEPYRVEVVGWEPDCDCFVEGIVEPVPCTVLDPFSGAGTTVLAADKLGRVGVGTELKPEYCGMASERVFNDAPLLSERIG